MRGVEQPQNCGESESVAQKQTKTEAQSRGCIDFITALSLGI